MARKTKEQLGDFIKSSIIGKVYETEEGGTLEFTKEGIIFNSTTFFDYTISD